MKATVSLWVGVLALASYAIPTPLTAAVNVYGEASSSGPVLTVNVFADITNTPLVSFGIRIFYDPQNLFVTGASKNTAAWYFSDGRNPVPYMDPDTSKPGEVWIIGGKLDALAPLQGVTGERVLLGTVAFGRLSQATPQFSLSLGQPVPYANFVANDRTVLDAQQGGVALGNVTPDPNDLNLNGLRDDWELRYFGAIGNYTWSDDPDNDHYNNLEEQALGSDPTDPNSNLRATIAVQPRGAVLAWGSFSNRIYTIETSTALPDFLPLQTGIAATPPTNQYRLFNLPDTAFYRIRLQTNN